MAVVYPLWQAERLEESAEEIERRKKQLEDEIDACTEVQGSYRNKVKKFLTIQEIWHISEIDYLIRAQYEEFLKKEVAPGSWRMYLKGFDRIKQHSIREQMETLAGRNRALKFNNQILFLPYHPDQELALQFERATKKAELVWDFSRKAPETMKRQIFVVLHSIISSGVNKKITCRNLLALRKFYNFCVKNHIEDIEKLELRQIQKFKQSLSGKQEQEATMHVVNFSRKAVFLETDEIHWNANVWYLERFHFESTRINPANPVLSLSFAEVTNKGNRKLLQQYMKYGLGITHLSISNLRSEFIMIRRFLEWLDVKMAASENVCGVDEEIMEDYFKSRGISGIQGESYNSEVMAILHFFDYLMVKGKIKAVPFHKEYLLKKTFPTHHDRSVTDAVQMEILSKLHFFPEELRLMFLHLWGIGLRASEVCALKGDAYYVQGRDAWIKVYQIKMKTYKRIPIPAAIYKLMKVFIRKYHIEAEDYVFQNRKGGAYSYNTFRTNMITFCDKNHIAGGEYLFQSHAYRHTVATVFYDDEVSIQGLRDYLGHEHEEMTRQYIDYMPRKISKANEKYFLEPKNSLGSGIKRCKRGG